MDKDRCAKILWALTKGFSTEAEDETQKLTNLRVKIGLTVFATDGAGFPGPASNPPQSKDWRFCARAAAQAEKEYLQHRDGVDGKSEDQLPLYLLLWPATQGSEDAPPAPKTKNPDLPLKWPLESKPIFRLDPVLDRSGNEVTLFGYSQIDDAVALEDDRDSGVGLFPRGAHSATMPPRPAKIGAASRPVLPSWTSPVFFGASIVLAILAMIWVYSTIGTLHKGGRMLLTGVVSDKVESKYALSIDGTDLETASEKANNAEEKTRIACLTMLQARMNAEPHDMGASHCYHALLDSTNALADKDKSRFFDWSQYRNRISLFPPMLISGASILLLIFAAGKARSGNGSHIWGAIIDERNRISLSRAQQLGWTMVLLGGFTILSVVNLTLMANVVRDVGQAQVIDPNAHFNVGNFFPSMAPELWAVLGITVLISPYLSRRILTDMDPDSTLGKPSEDADTVRKQPLNKRDNIWQARWSDLFTTEVANQGKDGSKEIVDISRLQHMVITLLLLGGYVILLAECVRTIDATAVLLAMATGAPVFASMPPIDETFVGLLALSHTGYLAFKNPKGLKTPGSEQ